MKILYGVAGEGYGHSSRAKAIIEYLQKQGHEVLVMAYGLAYKTLKNDFKIIKIEGIRFKFKKEKLSLSGTIKKSFPYIIKNIKTAGKRDKKILKFSPDLAITDFEPVAALYSYKYKIPLISIDNQHRLSYSKINVPKEYLKDYLLAKCAVLAYIPKADYCIVLSFAKQAKKGRKIFFVSPILRKEVIDMNVKTDNYIVVYMNQPHKSLIRILKKINEKFIVYGYKKEGVEGSLTFKRNSKMFLKDLASAKAVIASSGFTLMSESLFLKKPLFAIPLKGQFEQVLNALFLKNSKLGDYSVKPSFLRIQGTIVNISKYQKVLNKYKMNSNETYEILDKVIEKIRKPQIY